MEHRFFVRYRTRLGVGSERHTTNGGALGHALEVARQVAAQIGPEAVAVDCGVTVDIEWGYYGGDWQPLATVFFPAEFLGC